MKKYLITISLALLLLVGKTSNAFNPSYIFAGEEDAIDIHSLPEEIQGKC